MKLSHVVAGLGAMSILEYIYAYPGMKNTVREIQDRVRLVEKRSTHGQSIHPRLPQVDENENEQEEDDDPNEVEVEDPNDDGSLPPVLIGDLANPPPGGLTPIGQTIARILLEQEPGEDSTSKYRIPGQLTSKECRADVCCKWAYVSQELTTLFLGPTGRCNRYARAAIRLGFHDAGTWQEGLDFGGADGSIVLAKAEMKRKDNNGLADIVKLMPEYARKYGVGVADLIQFAAKHAVVTCPLGPRIRTFVGRKDSSKPSQEGLLPGVNDSADQLIDLFRRKTISPHELVALLGAHTTSEQFFVDTKRPGAPQDGTPGVWDTLFYNQTLGLGPMPRQVLRFPSDIVLANDPRTRDEWAAFSSGKDAQSHWNEDYAYSYIRLSLLGVNVINTMTECTKVLPLPGKSVKDTGRLLVNG